MNDSAKSQEGEPCTVINDENADLSFCVTKTTECRDSSCVELAQVKMQTPTGTTKVTMNLETAGELADGLEKVSDG